MNRSIRERIKTCVIAILIITGVVQMGILWNYQSQGFPFNFLSLFSSGANTDQSDSIIKNDIFKPFRIIYSNGFGYYWPINEKDPHFNELWEDARYNIAQAIAGKPENVYPLDNWDKIIGGSVVDRKGYIIQFKTRISTSLLTWLMDLKSVFQNAPDGVIKMLVSPGDSAGVELFNSVYIMDHKSIYRYAVKVKDKGFDIDYFKKMQETIDRDNEKNYRKYVIIRSIDGEGKFPFTYSRDTLISVEQPTAREYRQLGIQKISKLTDIVSTPSALLGNDLNSYRVSNNKDYILMSNAENRYKISIDGYLDYRYIPGRSSDGGSTEAAAFSNALKFISRGKQLMQGSNYGIYISDISESREYQGGYTFTFNYMVDGLPVYIDVTNSEGRKISNAIIIEADNDRVLSCRWLMADLEETNEPQEYDMMFTHYFNNSVEQFTGANIKEMGPAYIIKALTEKRENLLPVWVSEKADGSIFEIPLIVR